MSRFASLTRSPAGCWSAPRLAVDWLSSRTGVGAALLFAAIFISPQFVDAYGGDDILNANTPGWLILRGITFSQHLAGEINGAICGGRFFPMHQLQLYGVHCIATSETAFHSLVFVILMADLALFYYLMRLWRLDPPQASLGTLFLALLFQLRHFYDPILEYLRSHADAVGGDPSCDDCLRAIYRRA